MLNTALPTLAVNLAHSAFSGASGAAANGAPDPAADGFARLLGQAIQTDEAGSAAPASANADPAVAAVRSEAAADDRVAGHPVHHPARRPALQPHEAASGGLSGPTGPAPVRPPLGRLGADRAAGLPGGLAPDKAEGGVGAITDRAARPDADRADSSPTDAMAGALPGTSADALPLDPAAAPAAPALDVGALLAGWHPSAPAHDAAAAQQANAAGDRAPADTRLDVLPRAAASAARAGAAGRQAPGLARGTPVGRPGTPTVDATARGAASALRRTPAGDKPAATTVPCADDAVASAALAASATTPAQPLPATATRSSPAAVAAGADAEPAPGVAAMGQTPSPGGKPGTLGVARTATAAPATGAAGTPTAPAPVAATDDPADAGATSTSTSTSISAAGANLSANANPSASASTEAAPAPAALWAVGPKPAAASTPAPRASARSAIEAASQAVEPQPRATPEAADAAAPVSGEARPAGRPTPAPADAASQAVHAPGGGGKPEALAAAGDPQRPVAAPGGRPDNTTDGRPVTPTEVRPGAARPNGSDRLGGIAASREGSGPQRSAGSEAGGNVGKPVASPGAPGDQAAPVNGALAWVSAATAGPAAPVATAADGRIAASPGSASFAPQLAAHITTFVRDGVQQARLELNPVGMGPLTVQIQLDGNAARVHLAAEQAQTRVALEQAMPQLAGSLRESGLTLSGGGVFEQPRQQQPAPGGFSGGNGDNSRESRDPRDGRRDGPRDATASGVTGSRATSIRRQAGLVDLVA